METKPNLLSLPPFLAEKLQSTGFEFVITGGGGWIGQAALEMLDSTLGEAIEKRVTVFGSTERTLQLRSGRSVLCRELKRISEINDNPKLFLHCAYLTKDRLQNQTVENFVTENEKINDTVATAMEKSNLHGLFVPSSGAVYKKGTRELDGDLQNNAYGVMKTRDELRFTRLATAKNVPVCISRLFNLSGPFINKHESYALASMIKCALAGNPITIRAPHRVLRSYIHVADFLALAFAMLLEPNTDDVPIFDTIGNETLEMAGLADLIRTTLGQPTLRIDRSPQNNDPDDRYVGDGEIMMRQIRGRGLILQDMPQQIRDTAAFMQTS